MTGTDDLNTLLDNLYDQCDDYQLYDAMGTATKILTTYAYDDALDDELECDLWELVERIGDATDMASEVRRSITAVRKKRQ